MIRRPAGSTPKERLELRYRAMYWEKNELQIIGTPACMAEAAEKERIMTAIVKELGYTPEV